MASSIVYPIRTDIPRSYPVADMPSQPQPQQQRPQANQTRSTSNGTSGASSSRQRPQLVFMNYTDPAADGKKAENRKVIARYAMLNRPRGSSQTSETISPPSTTASSPPPRSTMSSSCTATIGDLQEHYGGVVGMNGYNIGYGSVSPPDTWSTTDGSPPYLEFTDLQPGQIPPGFPVDYFDTILMGDVAGLPDAIDINNSLAQDLATSQFGTQFQFPSDPLPILGPPEPPNPDTSQDNKRKERKKKNAKESKSQALAKGRKQKENLQIIGAAVDPFEVLPIKADAHTHELVYLYLHAQLVSKVFAKPGSQVLDRLKRSRDAVWWPLTRNSKAALAALSE